VSLSQTPDEIEPDEPQARTSSVNGSLRQTTARGVVWSLASFGGQAVLQIVALSALGRLLTPAQVALFAAATLVVGFAIVIGQFGVAAAVVQKPKLSTRETGAAFLVAILASVVLSAIISMLVPLLGPLLGIAGNTNALRLLLVVVILTGVGAVPLGLLQRSLRFRVIAAVDILAYLVGAVGLSILLALLGFGAYSLVWGQIVTVTVQSVGYLILCKAHPRLGSPKKVAAHSRELMRFGLPYSVGLLGNWIALNGDNFIVATTLSAPSLGLYSRAYQLLSASANLIGGVADRVLFPAMSAVQDDKERLTRAYVTSASVVAMVTIPASIALFASAPDLVHVLLGDNWNGVIFPLQVFAVILLPRASYRISGSFTRALGAVRGNAWRQWLYAGEVVVFCLIGSRWGIDGVAIGAAAAMVSNFFAMIQFSSQVANGLWRKTARSYLRYIPLAFCCSAIAVATLFLIADLHIPFVRLLIIIIVVLGTAAVVVGIGRSRFTDELSLVRSVANRRGGKPQAPVDSPL
jgi:O-antigen/teichoic acid export membrane protein